MRICALLPSIAPLLWEFHLPDKLAKKNLLISIQIRQYIIIFISKAQKFRPVSSLEMAGYHVYFRNSSHKK